MATDSVTEQPSVRAKDRLDGLDGIRGLAALFVMLHHCWLVTFPGFPVNTGPWWTGWLLYGHFAVVVFIVLSGFSLAVSPARKDWQLGGVRRFAHRRAWRILPPYWAALVFSLIIAWAIIPQPSEAAPDGKTVAVYGLLLQDAFDAPAPNGAFWSIAVEAHLYLVFPIMLILLRRFGSIVMVTAVTLIVVTIGALAPSVAVADALMRFIPQFATLFALGVVAAGVLAASQRLRQLPWHWFSGLAVLPVLVLIIVKGSVWTVEHYFWVDLALGPAAATLLAAIATGRPSPLIKALDTRPLRRLGSFSYSLYLTHAPIVWVISQKVVAPNVGPGVPAFLTTLAISAPLTVAFAWGFASLFELPFQRHRGWASLRPAIQARLPRVATTRARYSYRPAHDGAAPRSAHELHLAHPTHPANPGAAAVPDNAATAAENA